MGFYCFTQPEPIVVPTLKQQVKSLTDEQRLMLLKGYRIDRPVEHYHSEGLPKDIVQDVYDTIDAIQLRCKALMRGEVIITEAILDSEGFIITPAVMNTPPAIKTELKNIVKDEFNDTFPNTFTADVMEEMFAWSKYDGSGTYVFYSSQIIL